ncbi:hypothetical protein [Aliidiomarina haloalkalitolerans]|uniref:Uncharacterized protein n=1 Tax=Aliidiomarina haloalkalitolerans TaxID=859059 RepID=A0A432VPJ7_9GAMM|nr:hypothetical protein [Aliidiomarina haloalkalitolerans]RUO18073.1 hypothetical protein CWE06_11910 [Aliidiomarina haloalkalitolerans]
MKELKPKSRRQVQGAGGFNTVIALIVVGMLMVILSHRFLPIVERVEQESLEQVAMQLQQLANQANLAWQARSHRDSNRLVLSERRGLVRTNQGASEEAQTGKQETWFLVIDRDTGYPVSAGTVTSPSDHARIENQVFKSNETARTMQVEDCKKLLLATLRFSNEAAVSTNFAERENSRFFVTVKENGTTKICVFYQTSTIQSLLEPPEGDDYREVGNNFAYDPVTGTVDVNLNRSLTTTGL